MSFSNYQDCNPGDNKHCGHGTNSNYRVNSQPGKSFHTTISNMLSSNEDTVKNKNQINWVLHSRCIDHTIKKDKFLKST